MKLFDFRLVVLVLFISICPFEEIYSQHIIGLGVGWLDEDKIPLNGYYSVTSNDLLLPVDARSKAMGGTSMDFKSNPNIVFGHVSLLALSASKFGIGTNHTSVSNQNSRIKSSLTSISTSFRKDSTQAFGLGFQFFEYGRASRLDIENAQNNPLNPNNTTISLSWSKRFLRNFAFGATLKGVRVTLKPSVIMVGSVGLYDDFALAGSVELSYRKQLKNNVQFLTLISLQNVGNKTSYTASVNDFFLPSTVSFGTSFSKRWLNKNQLTIQYESFKLLIPSRLKIENYTPTYTHAYPPNFLVQNFDSFSDSTDGLIGELSEIGHAIGFEYIYRKKFVLRAGYRFENYHKESKGFPSFGLGFKIVNRLDIDVSFFRLFIDDWYFGENTGSISMIYHLKP